MQKEKDFTIYINTGFVFDSVICKGYKSKEDAIKDLRLKFDNYDKDFIVTKEEFFEYKRNKIKGQNKMQNYILYYNIEGKILEDASILAFFGETLKKFKSIKGFKKAVSNYNYKYLGYKEPNFKSSNFSNINKDFISRKNKEYNINY